MRRRVSAGKDTREDLGNDAQTISLWQNNMLAVRFEIEVAFAVKNAAEFVLLTGDTPSA